MSDLIRREDAVEAILGEPMNEARYPSWYASKIKALPSAEAVHKPDYSYEADMVRRMKEALSAEAAQGEWIPIKRGDKGYSAGEFKCSICGKPNKCFCLTDFCPNCGAKMKGADDED